MQTDELHWRLRLRADVRHSLKYPWRYVDVNKPDLNGLTPLMLASSLPWFDTTIFQNIFVSSNQSAVIGGRMKIYLNDDDFDIASPIFNQLAEQEAVLKLLIDAGANIDASDTQGRTALDWVLVHGRPAVIRLLLLRGATFSPQAMALIKPRSDVFQRSMVSTIKEYLANLLRLEGLSCTLASIIMQWRGNMFYEHIRGPASVAYLLGHCMISIGKEMMWNDLRNSTGRFKRSTKSSSNGVRGRLGGTRIDDRQPQMHTHTHTRNYRSNILSLNLLW